MAEFMRTLIPSAKKDFDPFTYRILCDGKSVDFSPTFEQFERRTKMSEKIIITEEMHHEKEWFAEARKQTVETLPAFINHLMGDYEHDYGTVVHAISACAVAAAWAADNTPEGGITGFQASFIMWDFIRQWSKQDNKCGLRLVDYDLFLYPQYEYRFEKTLNKNNWAAIQKEAQRLLDEAAKGYPDGHPVHPDVIAHWKSIVDGKVPFGYSVVDD